MIVYPTTPDSIVTKENGRQPRLLVVDDDSPTAQALQMYLMRQGYEVHVAYSGQSALNEVESYQPELLILDLVMPDMSGLDVAMRLRSDSQRPYLPIIMITAQDQERRRLQSMLSGADDYLSKPVNELELLVRVQALLRTKAHLDRLWEDNLRLMSKLEARNRELEQALQAVEAAGILKQNILNAVGHELGTPLMQVKAAVHLIVEEINESDPQNSAAPFAVQALSRLETVINNLRALSSSENLKSDPFVIVDAVELALRAVDKAHHPRIQREIETGLPPLYADRRGVARLLTILIDNALKFDPDNHPVQLVARRVDETQVWVGVIDQGIGIPEDQRERIFEEFYQIDSSSTRRFGGSGVGLALARLLCNRMNMTIQVESEVGQGSTFSVLLPVADLR